MSFTFQILKQKDKIIIVQALRVMPFWLLILILSLLLQQNKLTKSRLVF